MPKSTHNTHTSSNEKVFGVPQAVRGLGCARPKGAGFRVRPPAVGHLDIGLQISQQVYKISRGGF